MYVHGLATAHPAHTYDKSQCWEAFQHSEWFDKLDRRSRAIAQTVLQRETKDGRTYLSGFLGGDKVLLFQDKAEPESWNLLLQEPTDDERARWEQRKAVNGRRQEQDGKANASDAVTATRPRQRRASPAIETKGDGRPFNDGLPFLAA